jgi:pimeloyl-ACP methyl ester carboxylesterase
VTDVECLEVGELRLEVCRAGCVAGDAPWLVLLHEGLGCVSMWRDFPERLAERTGWGVLAYSRAGYGASSPCRLPRPLSYMHEEAFGALPALLDAVGFRDGVLVGHSDGASIATIHAGGVRDPRVRGLVLMAPHFFTEPAGLASIARAREAWRHGDLRERLARHHGDNVDCAFLGWNDAWLDPDFVCWDICDHLRRVRVPMLVIQGENDEYGSVRQLDAARDESGGTVEVALLSECGHSPQRDQAPATLDAIAGFTARLDADAGWSPAVP